MNAPGSPLKERLRQERQRAGMSLAQLAEETAMSKTYLLRLETDADANPSLDVLRRIADALDVTVADLLGAPATRFVADEADVPPSLRIFADEERLSPRDFDSWPASAGARARSRRAPSAGASSSSRCRRAVSSTMAEVPRGRARRAAHRRAGETDPRERLRTQPIVDGWRQESGRTACRSMSSA